jgi:hypothetical protein
MTMLIRMIIKRIVIMIVKSAKNKKVVLAVQDAWTV